MIEYNLEKTLKLKSDKLKNHIVYIHGHYTGTFSLKDLKQLVKNNGGKLTDDYTKSTLIIYNFVLRPVYNPTINDYHRHSELPFYIKDLKIDESYSMGEIRKFYTYIIEKELEYLNSKFETEYDTAKYYIFTHIDFISYLYETHKPKGSS